MHVTCWGRTTHVGGPGDARLQDYQVSSVRCHRFVTVTAAQKISFIFKSGRPLVAGQSIYFICSILIHFHPFFFLLISRLFTKEIVNGFMH